MRRTWRFSRPRPTRRPLRVEPLEDRVLLASQITVIVGEAGSGDQDANLLADSMILFADPDLGANTLSTGALAMLDGSADVIVEANGPITFNDLGGSLALATAAGQSVTFRTASIGGAAITFASLADVLSTAGAALVFDSGAALTLGGLDATGGDITLTAATDVSAASLNGGNVRVTSASGAITTSGPGAFQAAARLTLSAANGITVNTLAAEAEAINSSSGVISLTQIDLPLPLIVAGNGVVNSATNGLIQIVNIGDMLTVAPGAIVQSADGAIFLAATDLDIGGTIDSGNATTTLANSVDGAFIDLGTDTPGTIGLTDAEIDRVTAIVLRIGSTTTGGLSVTAPITPANTSALALQGGTGNIGDDLGASIVVPQLRLSGVNVRLDNSDNDVDILAGNAVNVLVFSDSDNLTVGSVDGGNGITAAGVVLFAGGPMAFERGLSATNFVQLNAGGVVSQGPGPDAAHMTSSLLLLGPGPYELTNAANNTTALAANIAGSLTYTDADALSVQTVSLVGFGSASGLLTQDAPITVATVNGNLTLAQFVVAGDAAVRLTAGGLPGADRQLIAANTITGLGGVTLRADAIDLTGLVSAGTATVTLLPFEDGTFIELGGADAAGTLGLTDAELDQAQAATLIVGSPTAGVIGVTAPIDPVLTTALTLRSNGSISQTSGSTLTVDTLTVEAAAGVTLNENNSISRVSGIVTDGGAPFDVTTARPALTVGGVTTNDGPIALLLNQAGGLLTVAQPITAGDADVTLLADDMALDAAISAGSATVALASPGADVAIDLGADTPGRLGLTDGELDRVTAGALRVGRSGQAGGIRLSGAITETGSGYTTLTLTTDGALTDNTPTEQADLTVTRLALIAGGGIGGNDDLDLAVTQLAFSNVNGAVDLSNTGSLQVAAVDLLAASNNDGASTTVTSSQALTLASDVATAGATTFTAGALVLLPGVTVATGDNPLTLTADNIDLQTTGSLTSGTARTILAPRTPGAGIDLGGADTATALGLTDSEIDTVTAAILQIGHASSGNIRLTAAVSHGGPVLSLVTGGAVVDATAGEQTDLTTVALAIRAATGVGSGDDLDIATMSLAVQNSTNGAIDVSSPGGLALGAVDGLGGASNAATGGTIRLRAGDALTLPAGIVVQSGSATPGSGGTITLEANAGVASGTDSLSLGAGAQVLTTGSIVLNADPDGDCVGGAVVLGTGAVLGAPGGGPASSVAITTVGDFIVTNPTAQTALTLTVCGNLGDDGDNATFAQAPTITLDVRGGIGTALAPIVIDAATLQATSHGNGLFVRDTAGGLQVATAQTTAGDIDLRAAGPGADLTVQNATTPSGTITLQATGRITGGSISGTSLVVPGASGVGSTATPLVVNVRTLAALAGAEGLFIQNSGVLTIGTLSGVVGLTSGGPTVLTASSLDVASNVESQGAVALTVIEGADANLTVLASARVRAAQGNVQLRAGDGVTVAAGATVQAADGTVILGGGVGDTGDGGGVTLRGAVSGNAIQVEGSAAADVIVINPSSAAGPIVITDAGGVDSFTVTPQTGATIDLDGGDQAGDRLTVEALSLPLRTTPGQIAAVGRQRLAYAGVSQVFVNNAGPIDTFTGPNTADRDQLAGLTADQRFIRVLYLDVLGRAGGQAEIDYWVGQLRAPGATAESVVQAIERSAEARERLVRAWYVKFLGREPAPGEPTYWTNRLLAGESEESVVADILGSTEYFNAHGGTNDVFVRGLYNDLLGRVPSDGEVTYWAGVVAVLGRSGVARAFLTSLEYRGIVTDAYFVALLHRPSSAGERDLFATTPFGLEKLRAIVEASAEFYANG